MNKYLVDCLNEFAQRPGMFIGTPSVCFAAHYISGFCYSIYKLSVDKSAANDLASFCDWIFDQYSQFESVNMHWSDILREVAGGDREGFYLFIEKWNEFCENYSTGS